MNADMFGTLPDGTVYTKRRNLWDRPKVNVATYKGYECEKWTCRLGNCYAPVVDMLVKCGQVTKDVHFTISFDYIFIVREVGTTDPFFYTYIDGYATENGKKTWFGQSDITGNRMLQPCEDWTHQRLTTRYDVKPGEVTEMKVYPAYLRDIDADLYIRNILVTYGDEDYPYTPAPEDDETVVI